MTLEQIDFIKDNYLTMTDSYLAEILGLKESVVFKLLSELKLHREPIKNILKVDETKSKETLKEFIRDNYVKLSDKEIAKVLNLTAKQVALIRYNMGIKRRLTKERKHLTKEEIHLIKKNANKMSYRELSKLVKASVNCIHSVVFRHKINKYNLKGKEAHGRYTTIKKYKHHKRLQFVINYLNNYDGETSKKYRDIQFELLQYIKDGKIFR